MSLDHDGRLITYVINLINFLQPSDNRQSQSRPLSETSGAVLHPEMTDEILPGETVDGVSVLYTYITMVNLF